MTHGIRPLRALLAALPALLALTPAALAHGVSAAQRQVLVDGGPLAYLLSGALHMLTGYDHLLFLFGVVFFLTRFVDVVTFVTAFTLGHSITLIAATLLGITANAYLIDAVIALSVIYKGFENTDGFRRKLGVAPPDLLWMVFAFGLIHGFGLSTRLQELPLPEDGLVVRILAFNLGVELGQVAALTAMIVLIAGWRRTPSFQRFSLAANYGLMAIGVLLLLSQLHGYQHTVGDPENLSFNQEEHLHRHRDMDAAVRAAERDNLTAALPPADFHALGVDAAGGATVTRDKAVLYARQAVDAMVERAIVEAHWLAAAVASAERRLRYNQPGWTVVLQQPQAADPARRELYVFLDTAGRYLAASHTGR